MSKGLILVVEDEPDILGLIEYNLKKHGYEVRQAASGEEALEVARTNPPDLVVLDLMLPGLDGIDVCKALRTDPSTAAVPILMLTARDQEADIVTGLEVGADDYMTKPFSVRVLLARVKALLRRRRLAEGTAKKPLRFGELLIDPERFEVRAGPEKLALTRSEFELLHFLASRPGRVFTRDQIIQAIHGDNYVVTDRTVDVLVAGVRKKLGAHGARIETVRGVGYRFREPEE
ncbi:MAG: response regulator transcription factor [candidate division KSB1 bacterium]|nr:response regulator transcription factor [candidate division KSB1 bacterium]